MGRGRSRGSFFVEEESYDLWNAAFYMSTLRSWSRKHCLTVITLISSRGFRFKLLLAVCPSDLARLVDWDDLWEGCMYIMAFTWRVIFLTVHWFCDDAVEITQKCENCVFKLLLQMCYDCTLVSKTQWLTFTIAPLLPHPSTSSRSSLST